MLFLDNNVKYRLGLSIFLMAALPVLAVSGLVIFFVLPVYDNYIQVIGLTLLLFFLSGTGFFLARRIVLPALMPVIGKGPSSVRAGHKRTSGERSFIGKDKEQLNSLDRVTGLYDFIFLREQLKEEIVRGAYYQRPCSLLVVDIDDIKEYTRKFGEQKKNEMINEIISLLREDIPPVGKIARFSSGEFGVLLPETNKKEAIEIAEILRSQVENLELSEELDNRITVSIGVGENPIDGINEDEIIDKTRKNVKKAKKRGKNQIVSE